MNTFVDGHFFLICFEKERRGVAFFTGKEQIVLEKKSLCDQWYKSYGGRYIFVFLYLWNSYQGTVF